MSVAVHSVWPNWSVEVISAPTGQLPTSTYLRIYNPQGALTLAGIPFSSLTSANWGTYRVVYHDANPDAAEIRSGDSLLIDQATYPDGSTFRIDNGTRTLAMGSLH